MKLWFCNDNTYFLSKTALWKNQTLKSIDQTFPKTNVFKAPRDKFTENLIKSILTYVTWSSYDIGYDAVIWSYDM